MCECDKIVTLTLSPPGSVENFLNSLGTVSNILNTKYSATNTLKNIFSAESILPIKPNIYTCVCISDLIVNNFLVLMDGDETLLMDDNGLFIL